jgi:hypothetical protein
MLPTMSNKRIVIICGICFFLLPLVFYLDFSYKTSREYSNATLPNYALNKETNQIIFFESPQQIAQNLLAGEEYFKGYLKVRALTHDQAEITMGNEITGDDAMTAIEYYVIADRTDSGWKISQYKIHWKCRGIFPNFWTTTACL